MKLKTCRKCGQEKPATAAAFMVKVKTRMDGSIANHITSPCRECANGQRRVRREQQPEFASQERERVRKASRLSRHLNPGARAIHDQRRRARLAQATPAWFGELDELVLAEAYDLADRRALATGRPWRVDHMVPLASRTASGLHCAANFQVIPAWMNEHKGRRMILIEPGEWITWPCINLSGCRRA